MFKDYINYNCMIKDYPDKRVGIKLNHPIEHDINELIFELSDDDKSNQIRLSGMNNDGLAFSTTFNIYSLLNAFESEIYPNHDVHIPVVVGPAESSELNFCMIGSTVYMYIHCHAPEGPIGYILFDSIWLGELLHTLAINTGAKLPSVANTPPVNSLYNACTAQEAAMRALDRNLLFRRDYDEINQLQMKSFKLLNDLIKPRGGYNR